MTPGSIRDSNFTFKAPPDMENCQDLRVRIAKDAQDNMTITSAWYPSPDEVRALAAGQPVWVTVWGNGLPPMALGVPVE